MPHGRSSSFAAILLLAGAASAQTTSQVNVSSTGVPSFDVFSWAMNEDGRFFAFESADPEVVPGVSNGRFQVYVHDRATGTTEIASVDPGGAAGDRDSSVYALSADGRFFVFNSRSTNLVPGTSNGMDQIYVRDRATGTTTCESLDPNGVPANGWCTGGPISADGRFVIFTTDASNLVTPDLAGQVDVFVRDRQTGITSRASVNSAGREANGFSDGYGISADGSSVLFRSEATNLVPGDTNGTADCFLRDLRAGTTERVNLAADGAEADGYTDYTPVLSADGRFVLFSSDASNLVPGDTNGKLDAFLRDRSAGTTIRVSLTSSGAESVDHVEAWGMSADARYVVLTAHGSDLVPGDLNGKRDVVLLDRGTGELDLVSLAHDGAEGNESSDGGRVSNDGRFVCFTSGATNLVPPRGDFFGACYVRDRGPTVEAFCLGDGSASPCPCNNVGSSGHGCDNSEQTGGAVLQASGRTSLGRDQLVLATAGVRANAACVLIQASLADVPGLFGDGLLCLAAPMKKLYVAHAAGNLVRAPRIGEPPISARSARRGAPILPGSSRFYQTYYRDTEASFCPTPAGNDWNVSNGLAIVWSY